jgi:TP901 family phage tail tape measure protein
MAEIAELQVTIDSRKAESAQKRVDRNFKKLDRSAKKTSRTMQTSFKGAAASLNKVRLAVGGIIVAMGVRQGIRTLAQFEQEMANVRAVAGNLSEKEFKALTNTARELGKVTIFSASQAAEGMRFLAMAGFDANEIIGALPGTLDLAAAGMVDMATAADISSNVLQSFGLEVNEMGRVADVLASATASSNQNMYELAEAVKYAAPLASSLGIELEDIAAGAAVLANQGIKASMAGTTMRQMFVKLLDPAGDAVAILDAYNLTIEELNPRTNSLIEVFEKLQKLQPEDLIKVFGARGIAGASAITRNMGQMIEYMQAFRDVKGTAKEIAEMRMDTLVGDWAKLKAAVEEVTLKMGDEGASGAMRKFIQLTTKGVQFIDNNFDVMTDTITIFGKIAESIVWSLHGVFHLVFGTVKEGFLNMLDWMLDKFASAMNQMAQLIPENRFTTGARGELLGAYRGVGKARMALRANMEGGFDKGEFEFNRAANLRQEAAGIAQARAGKTIAAGLPGGGPQIAPNADAAAAAAQAQAEEFNRAMTEMEISAKRPAEAFMHGWDEATKSFGTMGERISSVGDTLAMSIDQNMTDALMGLVDGTKSVGQAFQEMSTAIIKDLIRVMIQQLIVRQVMQGFGGLGAGATVAVAHQGGVIGSDMPGRYVDGGRFSGAKRYQDGGIAGDEVPAILHRGEVVLNDEQVSAMGAQGKGGKTEIINVTDPRMIDERIAENPNAIINVIGKNSRSVRRALGL